jgi:hypothetical protein
MNNSIEQIDEQFQLSEQHFDAFIFDDSQLLGDFLDASLSNLHDKTTLDESVRTTSSLVSSICGSSDPHNSADMFFDMDAIEMMPTLARSVSSDHSSGDSSSQDCPDMLFDIDVVTIIPTPARIVSSKHSVSGSSQNSPGMHFEIDTVEIMPTLLRTVSSNYSVGGSSQDSPVMFFPDSIVSNDADGSSSPRSTTSDRPSSPQELMQKLSKSMERTAMSRSLVEQYRDASKPVSNYQPSSVLTNNFSLKNAASEKSRTSQKDKPCVRKASCQIVKFLRQQRFSFEHKTADFRCSGLKLSKTKLQSVDEKLSALQASLAGTQKENQITSFLRQKQLL